MKTIFLMRHAKSSWDDSELEDHERPLAPRGRKAARRMAKYFESVGYAPSIVLCTSAVRARETLDLLKPALPEETAFEVELGLYLSSGDDLLDRIRRLSSEDSVLAIGHNPAMQQLVLSLASEGPQLMPIRKKFPTAALAVLEAGIDEWKELGAGKASLVNYVTPKGLPA